MRVVAGAFKGRRLHAPRGARTRPTADRVREALSRGAASATFVERDPRAVEAIRRNLAAVGLDAEVRRQDVLRFLAAAPGTFDLVFVDPPYDSAARLAGPLSERLPPVLGEGARVVTESDKRAPLELSLALDRERVYGDTRIAVHRA